jgi:hypothetical protein
LQSYRCDIAKANSRKRGQAEVDEHRESGLRVPCGVRDLD